MEEEKQKEKEKQIQIQIQIQRMKEMKVGLKVLDDRVSEYEEVYRLTRNIEEKNHDQERQEKQETPRSYLTDLISTKTQKILINSQPRGPAAEARGPCVWRRRRKLILGRMRSSAMKTEV